MTFRKAEYITDFAEKVHTGAFDLNAVAHMGDEDAIRALSGLKGIGVRRFWMRICNAGTYCTRIVDREISCGKTCLVVQNARNGFMRPAIAELPKEFLWIEENE